MFKKSLFIICIFLNVLIYNNFIVYSYYDDDFVIDIITDDCMINEPIIISGKFLSDDIISYQFWIEKPNGKIEKTNIINNKKNEFYFRYYPFSIGKYEIELIYTNKYGPQVAFQKQFYVKSKKNNYYTENYYKNINDDNYLVKLNVNTDTYLNFDEQMILFINNLRDKYNVKPLYNSKWLKKVADKYAYEIAQTKHFEHISKDGRNLLDRIFEVAIKNKYENKFGENLVIASDVKEGFNKLLKSVAHKNSLIDPDFNYIGIGVSEIYINNKKYYVIVQNFAKKDI